MNKLIAILLSIPFFGFAQTDSTVIKSIYDETLSNSPIYENLRVLCKDVGHRLSGSTGAAAAVEYTKDLMESYDFDTVYLAGKKFAEFVNANVIVDDFFQRTRA